VISPTVFSPFPKRQVDERIADENAKKAEKPRSMRPGRNPKLPESREDAE